MIEPVMIMQEYFSHSPDADKMRKVQAQVDEVKSAMVQNIGMSRRADMRRRHGGGGMRMRICNFVREYVSVYVVRVCATPSLAHIH